MRQSLELRIFSACVSLFTILLLINGAVSHPLKTSATSRVRTLDQTQTDMIAHMYGTSWHAPGPAVVDFAPQQSRQAVVGVDQWLSARGRAVQPRGAVSGTKKFLVMHVYFHDKSAVSTYAKDAADEAAQSLTKNIEDDLLTPLKSLWEMTSYGHVSIAWDVTDLYQLPGNRSKYISDYSNGDLSDGCAETAGDGSCAINKYHAVLRDAVNALPAGYDLNTYDGVLVFMAETGHQFHRGQAKICNTTYSDERLPGVDTNHSYGCVVMSENPDETTVATYGRMGHEFGHSFQQNGPGHPSDYNNDFELMDANYPGQTGAFEKQENQGFPGWLPPKQYIVVDKSAKYDSMCIRAIEYDPATNAVPQVIKAKITDSLYYLLSVRRKVLGDDLNQKFSPNGIPEEGLLIERVNEAAIDYRENADGSVTDQQIVTVQGKGGDRRKAWQKGDTANFMSSDGVQFAILPQAANNPNSDYYCVRVSYDGVNSVQPDVSMRPWRESPGNTYETTDIWIDSPLNGYGTYRYGMWNDVLNVPVPRLNGDIPAVESVNRLYARVRNTGTKNATDIRVKFQVTDPAGTGIAGSNGWSDIGSVDKTTFPALATLAPGAYTDVYIEWTPNITLTEDMIKAGVFDFHTCLRVVIPAVLGESIFGNTDGDGEQENIFQFEATPLTGVEFNHSFTLRNQDVTHPITYDLALESALPPNWTVNINDGSGRVVIPPNELVTIPVTITVGGSAAIGSRFDVKIAARHPVALENVLADVHDIPNRYHDGTTELGGVDFAVDVLKDTKTTCDAYAVGTYIDVIGALDGFEGIHQAGTPLRAYAQVYDASMRPIKLDDRAKADVAASGEFRTSFSTIREKQTAQEAKYIRCIFPGTHLLASSASKPVEIHRSGPPPAPTPVPWAGSQFHFSGSLNQFLAPPAQYSDLIGLGAAGGRTFQCPIGKCPVLVSGIHGRGVRFSAAQQSFLASTTNLPLGGLYSVSLWAKRNRFGVAETLLSHGATVLTGHMLNIGFDEYGHVVCSTYGDEVISPRAITDTGWHQYRCDVDGADRAVYIDDTLEQRTTLSGSPPPYSEVAPVLIGRRADRPNSFDGVIDEVNVFTAFSANADQLYSHPGYDITGYTPISHLTFNDVTITQGTETLSCAGAACPIVTYPDTQVAYRPSERIAAIRFQRGRGVTITSTAPIAAGTDSTLLFWARVESFNTLGSIVAQSAVGRPRVYVATPGVLSFSGVNFTVPMVSAGPSFNTAAWHQYAFVKQGGQLAIYIDGNRVAEGAAPAGLLPFRVASTLTLAVGLYDGGSTGEYAGIELANYAVSGAQLADRYGAGIDPTFVVPTSTLTMSPTASPTMYSPFSPTPTATLPVLVFGRTQTASRLTATAIGADIATKTRQAQMTATANVAINSTLVAAIATRWANMLKTDTALQLTATRAALYASTRSPTPIRIVITFGTKLPTLTAPPTLTNTRTGTATVTANMRFTATKSATAPPKATETLTPSTTPTPTLSPTTPPTRTKIIVTNTLQPSPTSGTTLTSPTVTSGRLSTNTPTRTVTAAPTLTPNTYGLRSLPFGSLPLALRARALQHIADHRTDVGTDWSTITIGDEVIPFYRPDFGCCDYPAYYEVSLFADTGRTKPAGFLILTNDDPALTGANGATPHDFPITHWDSKGTAPSKILLKDLVPSRGQISLWKLDTLSYVAVQSNAVVSQMGNIPALIDGLTSDTFARYSSGDGALSELNYAPTGGQGVDDTSYKYSGAVVTTKGPQKKDAAGLWSYSSVDVRENYKLYLDAYSTAFTPLIDQLRANAARQWGIEKRRAPQTGLWSIPAPAGAATSVILPVLVPVTTSLRVTDKSAMLVSAPVLSTGINGYPILTVNTRALASGELPVARVELTDGLGNTIAYEFHLIDNNTTRIVAPVAAGARTARTWSGWSTWSAGSAAEQRDYNQFATSGCASGCGPTAWMMLFGWADAKSVYPPVSGQLWRRWNAYRAGGVNTGSAISADTSTSLGGVAHKTNTAGNENNAILYLRSVVGTFCFNGSGATAPWDMEGARYYLSYMGTGMGMTESHNIVGYHEDRLKNYARTEIASNSRPVVIGTGWMSHYPLAWKYQYRTRPENWDEGWFDGDDVVYDEQFYVNNGWGGNGNGWISAGTWFAGRVNP